LRHFTVVAGYCYYVDELAALVAFDHIHDGEASIFKSYVAVAYDIVTYGFYAIYFWRNSLMCIILHMRRLDVFATHEATHVTFDAVAAYHGDDESCHTDCKF
jgi:hypothetical protein